MAKIRTWTIEELKIAVKNSTSIRQVLKKVGLAETGGNYKQAKKYFLEYNISTDHFSGQAWNKGNKYNFKAKIPLEKILVKDSSFQTFKLKQRLFRKGIKKEKCELCGWAERSKDGRIPVELDHINGDAKDNRIENLRILCPNCHSLQPTHRGKNRRASGGIGRRARLKSV